MTTKFRKYIASDGKVNFKNINQIRSLSDPLYRPVKIIDPLDISGRQLVSREKPRVFEPPPDSSHFIFKDISKNDKRRILDLYLYELTSVYLSYDFTKYWAPEYYFFSKDRGLINHLFHGAAPFLPDDFQKIDVVEEPTVFAEDPFVNFNLCHFIFDKYPRIALARDFSNVSIKSAILWKKHIFYDFIASQLNLEIKSLNHSSRGTIYLKKCFVFSDSFNGFAHPCRYGSQSHVKHIFALRSILAKKFSSLHINKSDKYFIDRSGLAVRKIQNIEDTKLILSDYMFKVIDPSLLAPYEQVEIFLGAHTLAGVHGAGLSHLAFMNNPSNVIEIMPSTYASQAYWIMSNSLGHDYSNIVCNSPVAENSALDSRGTTTPARQDVIIPLDKLDYVLKNLPKD